MSRLGGTSLFIPLPFLSLAHSARYIVPCDFKVYGTMSKSTKTKAPLGVFLMIALGVIPLVKQSAFLDAYLLVRTVAWSALLLASGVYLFVKNKQSTWISTPVWIWMGFVVWMFSTRFFSPIYSFPEWAMTSSRFALYGSALLFTLAAIQSKLFSYKDFSRGLVLFGIVGGALGIGAYLQAKDVLDISSPFGHKNFLSAAMLISASGSLYSVWDKDKTWKRLGQISFGLSLLLIVLLKTRGVWIGTTIGIVFTFIAVIVFKASDAKKQLIPPRIVGIAFGIVLMALIGVAGFSKSKENVVATDNIELRLLYWGHSFQMFSEHPLTGVGAGQWKINFPKYGLEHTNTRVSNGQTGVVRPHNDYVWMFAEGGIIGGTLYLVFFGSVFAVGIKKLKLSEVQEEHKVLISALLIILGTSVYALGEFPIERVDLAIPMFIAIGFVLEGNSKFNLKPAIAHSLVSLLAFFPLLIGWQRMPQEKLIKEIHEGNDTQNPQTILRAFDKLKLDVADVDFVGNPLPYFVGLSKTVLGANSNNDPKLMAEAEEAFQAALAIHPYHLPTHNQYGNWYKYQGKFPEALAMYEEGLSISPLNIELRLNKAEVLIRNGMASKSAAMLLYIISEDDNRKYQSLVVQSIRNLKPLTSNSIIDPFQKSVQIETLTDEQVFRQFISYRDQLRK